MMDYYAVYDRSSGEMQWKGQGEYGAADRQQLPPHLATVAMPLEALVALPDDLVPLKRAVKAMVDDAAGAIRKQYITDVPGQQATYLSKEVEAKAWAAATNPAPADYPYLRCEAAAIGQPISAVVTDILTTAETWRQADARLEGRRRGAGVAIAAASNIAEIVAAATVDWPAALNT